MGLLAVAPSFAQSGQSGSQDQDRERQQQQPQQPGSSDRQQPGSTTRDHDRNAPAARDDQDKDRNRADAAGGQLSNAERKFLTNAAQGSMAEIELGKLAQERGFTEQAKDLGKKLAEDHEKALDKTKEIAQKNNFTLPDQPANKQKSVHDRLSRLSGVDFDRAFAREVEKHHKKDISQFEKMSQRAANNDVKEFASETVEKLKEHHHMASAITNVGTAANGKTPGMKSDEKSPRTDESSRPDDGSRRPDDSTRKPDDGSRRPDQPKP